MSLSVVEGETVYQSFTIALVGPGPLCEPLQALLRADSRTAHVGILHQQGLPEFLEIAECRRDIAVAVVVSSDGDLENVIHTVATLRAGPANPLMAVLLRSSLPLSVAQRRRLEELGLHGFGYQPAQGDEWVVNDIIQAFHGFHEKQALAELSEFCNADSGTESLTELSALSLGFLHRYGIGLLGGLFFLRRPTTPMTWITLGGTGQFEGVACIDVAELDIPYHQEILAQLVEGQDLIDDLGLWLRVVSRDGTQACLLLRQNESLRPWQRVIIQMFCRRLSVALDEVLLKRRLGHMNQATITTLATLAEYRDVDTGSHVSRVARMTTGVATILADAGVVTAADAPLVNYIGQASVLHDLGKVGIPDRILLKAGPLDADERAIIRRHTIMGQEILLKAARISDSPALMLLAADIARYHHEKFDGSGYPDGLAGEQIPLGARIVAVVDVYDALTGVRPYKLPWPEEQAIEFICAESGSHFDPRVVEAFLEALKQNRHGRVAAWCDSFSVGHDDIDQDHKNLFDILNQVWNATVVGNRQVLEMTLNDLTYYTLEHFQREEEFMLSFNYPHYESHRAAHDAFTQRIESLRWEYLYGVQNDINARLLNYLGDWLAGHIGQADRAYRNFLDNLDVAAMDSLEGAR